MANVKRSRILVQLSSIVCLSGAAAAAGLPDSLRACQKEQDDARRLACYDHEMAISEAAYGLSKPQKRQLAPPTTDKSASAPLAVAADSLSSIVLSVTSRADGRKSIELRNGQTWVQGEAFDTIAISPGTAVTIRPGLLGSYYMILPSKSSTRVTRVK